jgi:beta-lactamase superfamily II metal-dependent hydrolase
VWFATSEAAAAANKDKRLEVYWVDVEGGAATLVVTPAGESILVDTGFPGGRDAGRIHKLATEVAGLSKIDHVVVTHYHLDHFGGLAELAELMPVGVLWERGLDSAPERERADPRLEAYGKAKVGRRAVVRPGDEIRLAQIGGAASVRFRFLAANQKVADSDGVKPNEALCSQAKEKDKDASDNANSIAMVLEQGPFRLFDGGDLTWNVEGRLVCPADLVGKVDVFQASHHGLDQSNNPVLVKTLEPTVVVVNNGPKKGGEPGSFATFSATPSVKAIYQLHKNVREGAVNMAPERIANVAESCAGEHVRLSVEPSGQEYAVSVPATRSKKSYKTKRR